VKVLGSSDHLSNAMTTALLPCDATPAERASRTGGLDVAAIHGDYADFAWRCLQRLGVRNADLEDMLQEVFVVVHRRLHTFRPDVPITGWLFGICTRVASGYRRRSYVRRERSIDDEVENERCADTADPEEVAETRQARAQLETLLDELDVEKRAVFVMFEIEELECEEIAEILGVPVGTVYSRLHSARKAFDKAVARMKAREAHGRVTVRAVDFARPRDEEGGAR